MELEIYARINNKDECELVDVNNLIIYNNVFILVNTVKSNQSAFSKSMGRLHCQRQKRNIFTNRILNSDDIYASDDNLIALIRKKNSKITIKIKFNQLSFTKHGCELSFDTKTRYFVADTNVGVNPGFKKDILFDEIDLKAVISSKDCIINIYKSL